MNRKSPGPGGPGPDETFDRYSLLVSPDDLKSLKETQDIVRDDELMKSLRQSRQKAASGERRSLRDNT